MEAPHKQHSLCHYVEKHDPLKAGINAKFRSKKRETVKFFWLDFLLLQKHHFELPRLTLRKFNLWCTVARHFGLHLFCISSVWKSTTRITFYDFFGMQLVGILVPSRDKQSVPQDRSFFCWQPIFPWCCKNSGQWKHVLHLFYIMSWFLYRFL